MQALRRELATEAAREGFAAMGVCAPDATPRTAARLQTLLDHGRQGETNWMAERRLWRGSAAQLWPEARAVIMLAEPYTPNEDPRALLAHRDRGAISVYARNRDYHDPIKKRLKRLGRWLIARAGGDIKVFVDTAPVMEKPLAAAAGLGWQGKHTNLLSRELGNWFFLGAIFTTLDLPHDAPGAAHCGSCRRCLDICPTAAFPAPFQLDARRCISYLTIELKTPIPREMRPLIGNLIFGCDDCLAVCPWNKFAKTASGVLYQARVELTRPLLAHFAGLDDAGFREVFRASPVKRIGRARFLRNVLIAVGNAGMETLAPAAEARLDDPEPLVRGAAIWALSRLLSKAALAALARVDADPQVVEEWRAALA